ncbi:hypothetical protein Tco_0249623, partial [Tanacetum coccineum]
LGTRLDISRAYHPQTIRIKRLLDDLGVTAAKLMLLVYKLLLLVFKVTTDERVSTVREWIKTGEKIKVDWRSRLAT